MATVSERAGVVGPSELREIAWDTGSENGRTAVPGMVIPRVFSNEGTSPYDEVEWELRTAEIKDERGTDHLPADRVRNPSGLESARDERGREQVLLRRSGQRQRQPGYGKS